MNQFAFIVWSSLVAPLPFLALAVWMDGASAVLAAVQNLSLTSLAAVGYIAWVSTLLGFGLWTFLMSRYPVNRVAPFTLLVPVVGLTTGWWVFGEQLLPVHFAGAGLLMAGLVVNVFGGPAWAALKGRLRTAP
jgi:O-acetylserine/cysteine efflux transporter